MKDDGVIDFDFEEVGVNIDGAEVGMFSGSASIDQEENVVGLTLDAFDSSKQVTRYLKVPRRGWPSNFNDILAEKLAETIEQRFKHEITDKVNDWCVSIAEQEWQPEAAE